jgi:hypothetical protein
MNKNKKRLTKRKYRGQGKWAMAVELLIC